MVEGLDSFLAELLRQLPCAADPKGSKEAGLRLYPNPSQSEETNQEWAEYVHPELKHLFESASSTVAEDLEAMYSGETEGRHGVRIPLAHTEQWINTLNQARLVIAETNQFKEADIDQPISALLHSPRDLQLFQLHFYGLLQEILVRET